MTLFKRLTLRRSYCGSGVQTVDFLQMIYWWCVISTSNIKIHSLITMVSINSLHITGTTTVFVALAGMAITIALCK